jgi:hypothetical protein
MQNLKDDLTVLLPHLIEISEWYKRIETRYTEEELQSFYDSLENVKEFLSHGGSDLVNKSILKQNTEDCNV